MSRTYKAGEQIACPHCGQLQEDVVEDYVIPGKTGPSSAAVENCFECGDDFEVSYLGDGIYSVKVL
ncbi:hypothetical protein [Duganella vulcania]|uniref:CPXCG motif-containing cysteine-rich protein n=1 Tax=Duganella vulcania TaxID=2692166 RepID=A0A845GF99_9BURK|nr:hypothetical protein [Duganella vulcania]MYM92611.1 hypothetical protein [Duganella vulcania]